GKQYPYYTTMGGAYQHAAAHGDKPPYQLPESWMTKKPQVKLATPLNFVNTADSIGGNSGSPMVDSKGEVVGILFDGNIESLPWNFEYSDKVGRSISVDSRGIMEALRDIYGASRVVRELESGREQSGK
ncbi:MAG TPA: S46 family peptidase, partial [Terriglobales bacterium]|nr:S46 family peptidase [Terriglobales bacterium]